MRRFREASAHQIGWFFLVFPNRGWHPAPLPYFGNYLALFIRFCGWKLPRETHTTEGLSCVRLFIFCYLSVSVLKIFYMYLYRISRRPLKGETDRETIIFGLGLGALTTWPIHQQWPSKAFQISRKYIKVSFQMWFLGVPKTCQWKVICLHLDPCGGRQLFCVFIRAVWPVWREIAREDSLWER